jgi:hypothetical protein
LEKKIENVLFLDLIKSINETEQNAKLNLLAHVSSQVVP